MTAQYVVGIYPFGTKNPPVFYQYEDGRGNWFVSNLKEATRFTDKGLADRLAAIWRGKAWRLKVTKSGRRTE